MEQTLLYLIIYLTLVYAVILLMKKNRHSTDVLLAVWLVFVSLTYSFLYRKLGFAFSYTHCVFLYLYIEYTIKRKKFNIKDLLHFIPFVLSILLIVTNTMKYVWRPFSSLVPLYLIIYFTLSIRLIWNCREKKLENDSTEYSPDLFWLTLTLIVTIILHITNILPVITYYLTGSTIDRVIRLSISLVLLNILGLKALRMDLFFMKKISKTKASYATYGLKDSEINLLIQKLKELMEKEKLYLIPELSLKDLSDSLEISSHHLSFLLNTKFNQNFYDFINTYRLEAVKNELINPQKKHLSILAIACDCGFNSQSTFNRIFKQKVGLSPSKYREQYLLLA